MSDFTETNRAHWNKTASTYNSSNENTVNQLIQEIQRRRDWIGVDWISDSDSDEENEDRGGSSAAKPYDNNDDDDDDDRVVRLLDYACGTGMISRALGPYITSSTGIDLSENMVETFNTLASNQGLSSSEMHSVVGNLLDPSDASPSHLQGAEFFDFDIAAVGLGFHHFEDPVFAAKQLALRLKKGGVLMLVDFVTHEPFQHEHGHSHGHNHNHGQGHSHSSGHQSDADQKSSGEAESDDKEATEKLKAIAATVKHFGFSEPEMKAYFEAAGVGQDFKYDVIGKDVVFKTEVKTMTRRVFLCRGTKI